MQVRVKEEMPEGFYGFYGTSRRYPGEEFTLVDVKTKDGTIVKAEAQFSKKWMERIEVEDEPRRRGRPKAEEPSVNTDAE